MNGKMKEEDVVISAKWGSENMKIGVVGYVESKVKV